jgi:hypothetical protein
LSVFFHQRFILTLFYTLLLPEGKNGRKPGNLKNAISVIKKFWIGKLGSLLYLEGKIFVPPLNKNCCLSNCNLIFIILLLHILLLLPPFLLPLLLLLLLLLLLPLLLLLLQLHILLLLLLNFPPPSLLSSSLSSTKGKINILFSKSYQIISLS